MTITLDDVSVKLLKSYIMNRLAVLDNVLYDTKLEISELMNMEDAIKEYEDNRAIGEFINYIEQQSK